MLVGILYDVFDKIDLSYFNNVGKIYAKCTSL